MANIDIRDLPDVVEAVNAIISNDGVAQVKVEKHSDIVVVESNRRVKLKQPVSQDN